MLVLTLSAAFAQNDPPRAPPPDTGVADTGGDYYCVSITLTDSAPAAGAVNVPVDVRPTLVFNGGCNVGPMTIAVVNPATNAIVASMTWSVPYPLPATVTLTPESPLPFDADLVLTATDAYGQTYANVPFHTAAVVVPPLEGTLVVDVIDATVVVGSVIDDLTATVQITPIADPSGLSRVELTGPNGTQIPALDETT